MPSVSYHEIEAEAHRLGFVAFGMVAAHPVSETAQQQYRQWLAEGCAGEMHYLHHHTDMRFDPTRLVPGVKNIISVAWPFHTPSPTWEGRGETPFICAYAQGPDYHEILRQRLHQLLAFVGGKGRVFVDTAPVMERYWAVEAGLGTIGKGGMLTIPGIGNRVFLGEIFCEEEEPKEQRAQKNACIHSAESLLRKTVGQPEKTESPIGETGNPANHPSHCPCQALRDDGTIDARRCLNYLTIEYRGDLPEWTRPYLQRCFYGCDRCLEPAQTIDSKLPGATHDRTFWEHLTREQYDDIFGCSAVRRITYEGLMRNILHGKKG